MHLGLMNVKGNDDEHDVVLLIVAILITMMLLLLIMMRMMIMIAKLWRAKHGCGTPCVSKSTHPRKFGSHVTVHRPPARPSVISHFLASLGAQED